MTSILTTTLAVVMIAGSSLTFAADNKSGNKDGAASNANKDQTNSIGKDTKLSPEEMERCKTAPADDKTCIGAPKD